MANAKEIKRRMRSAKSNQQITKAMKMVSASKLRRAQGSVVSARPYKNKLKEVLARLVASMGSTATDPLLEKREVKKVGFVIFASNKGLCGGYNANIMKEAHARIKEVEAQGLEVGIVAIGRKTREYFLKHGYTLDEEFIKTTHKILKTNTSDSRLPWFNVGEYKSRRNMVADRQTTPPGKVKKEMDKLLNEYLGKQNISFDDILDFHVKFERIHPFQDGNGRTGRIIMFKECLKYNIVPFIIEDNLKMFYYRGLKEWDNEKGYLRDTCLTAQDRYKKLLDYFEIKYEN